MGAMGCRFTSPCVAAFALVLLVGSELPAPRGRVFAPDGSTVAGASVLLLSAGGELLAQTSSNGQGGFAFPGSAPEGSLVHARKNTVGSARSGPLDAGSSPLELRLAGPARLSGTLADRQGRPLAGLTLMAVSRALLASGDPPLDRYRSTAWHPTAWAHRAEGGAGLACAVTVTDAGGGFVLSGLAREHFVFVGPCLGDERLGRPDPPSVAAGAERLELRADLCRLDVRLIGADGAPFQPPLDLAEQGLGRVSCHPALGDGSGGLVAEPGRALRVPPSGGAATFWVASGRHLVAVVLPIEDSGAGVIDRRIGVVPVEVRDSDATLVVRLDLSAPEPAGRLVVKPIAGTPGALSIAEASTGLLLHPPDLGLPAGVPLTLAPARYAVEQRSPEGILIGRAVVEVVARSESRCELQAVGDAEPRTR